MSLSGSSSHLIESKAHPTLSALVGIQPSSTSRSALLSFPPSLLPSSPPPLSIIRSLELGDFHLRKQTPSDLHHISSDPESTQPSSNEAHTPPPLSLLPSRSTNSNPLSPRSPPSSQPTLVSSPNPPLPPNRPRPPNLASSTPPATNFEAPSALWTRISRIWRRA